MSNAIQCQIYLIKRPVIICYFWPEKYLTFGLRLKYVFRENLVNYIFQWVLIVSSYSQQKSDYIFKVCENILLVVHNVFSTLPVIPEIRLLTCCLILNLQFLMLRKLWFCFHVYNVSFNFIFPIRVLFQLRDCNVLEVNEA